MEITYKFNTIRSIEVIIELYDNAGLNRPTADFDRIAKMYVNSNLIVTAWDKDKLVGISRSLTDFCYCCYLSDLAVRQEYKYSGIGKKLVELTKEKVSENSMLLLLAAPSAIEYYPKIGMDRFTDCFLIKRKS